MDKCDEFVSKLLTEAGTTIEREKQKGDVASKVECLSKILIDNKNLYENKLNEKLAANSKLLSEISDLQKDLESLLTKSENVNGQLNKQIIYLNETSTSSYESAFYTLKKTREIRKFLNHVKTLYFILEDIKIKANEKKYFEAAILIEQFQEMKYSEYNADSLRTCKIFINFCSSCNQLKVDINNKIDNIISDIIKWITYEDGGCNHDKLIFEDIEGEMWYSLLAAMHHLNTLDDFLSRFSRNLLTKMFEPIIKNTSASFSIDKNSILLTIQKKDPKTKEENRKQVLKPENVLNSINQIIDFIGKKLSFQNEKHENLKKILRDCVSNRLSSHLFKMIAREIIDKLAPSSNEKIEKFNNLVSLGKRCQKTAEKYCLLQVDDSEINDMLGDAETAYISHKCSNLLSLSRSLLKQPLHNTVLVGDEILKCDDVDKDELETDEDFQLVELQPMFAFPCCHISESIKMLWHNIEQLVEDVADTNQQSITISTQLYKCIRHVVELYINIVPLIHNDTIQSLPFATAIHHNNCMYMAHRLTTFQRRMKYKFKHYPNFANYVDFVDELQEMAVENFLLLLQQQTQNILQIWKINHGFDGMNESSNYETTIKSWRKISLELKHLSKAWIDVLPPTVFHKSIGSLYNGSLKEILYGIIKLEDISEVDAQKLTDLISIIENDGIELMSPTDASCTTDIHSFEPKMQQHIELWNKMKELKFVLNARLIEIRDRWASGKGPLAETFTRDEMDGLIRALFQNTEMRSAVLSVINGRL